MEAHIDRPLVATGLVLASAHIAVYVILAGNPLGDTVPFWREWWDQGQQLQSAQALAAGDWRPERHWYPLGYAVLGAPFVALLPRDPFVVVNTLSFVAFGVAFVAYFRPVLGAPAALGIFAATHLLPWRVHAPHPVDLPVWLQYVIPWNTIPVAAALLMVANLLRGVGAGAGLRADVALGVLGGAVVAIRPSDALPLLVIAVPYAYARAVRQRTFTNVVTAAAAALIVAGSAIGASWAIHGRVVTPYHEKVGEIGGSVSDLHERAYALVIDATTTHGTPRAALAALHPWLLVTLPFAIAWAAADRSRGLPIVTMAIVSLTTYVAFNDFWPYAAVRFFLIHYVVWTLPVFAAAGMAGAVVLIRRGALAPVAAALGVAILLTVTRVIAQPLDGAVVTIDQPSEEMTAYTVEAPSQEIDAVDFRGATARDTRDITVRHFKISADGRPLTLYRDYRAIQLTRGLRIIFNRHLVAGRIECVLERSVTNHPTAPSDVRVLRFRFWVW